jgi:hypothetical protein
MRQDIHESLEWVADEEPTYAPRLNDGAVLDHETAFPAVGDREIQVVNFDR